MPRSFSLYAANFVMIAVGLLSACGSGRQLQSVAVSPVAADAKDYPGGQVLFTATGTFSKPPSPASLSGQDIVWCYGGPANVTTSAAGICAGNVIPIATVDQNGVAQCNSTYSGTATILAGTPSKVMVMADAGPQLKVFGSATLTCP